MKALAYGLIGGVVGEGISKIILSGGPATLIAWGIIGLILGWLSGNKKEALIAGAIFGFVASFLFMWLGYNGTDPVTSKLLFFIFVGLFGAICGGVSSLVGFTIKSKTQKS